MTAHRYVSWYRRGIGALRTQAAMSTANPANPIVKASVTVNGTATDLTITLHGPADIAGLAAAAIVRRDPPPTTTGVSPNGIAYVELSPPDLPWRFSPAATPSAGAPLRPWLMLVVVPASAPLGPQSGAPLPVLQTTRGDLPDPEVSWAWAHVQVEEPDTPTMSVADVLRDHPERAVARLLAPRRLAPNSAYRACLVPTYLAGARAGLGQAIGDAGTTLAWRSDAPATDTIQLPVYDSWLVSTGDVEDFETLARKLTPRGAASLFSPLRVDVRTVAGTAAPTIATMYGLVQPDQATTTLPDAGAIATTLRPWLTTDDSAEPAVGPPLYAAAQAGIERVNDGKPWQQELNLDPRRRIQAEAGAAVVRADQEQIVAEACAAIGEIDRANTVIRGTQLAALLSTRLVNRHVAPRPPERVSALLMPLLAATEHEPAAASSGLLSAAMRRLSRPAGPIARGRVAGIAWSRLGHDLGGQTLPPPLLDAATKGQIEMATPTVTIAPTMPRARVDEIKAGLHEIDSRASATETIATVQPVDVHGAASAAVAAVSPTGIVQRVSQRISGMATVSAVVELVELRASPEISRPLANRLVEQSPDMFAPGVSDLPGDTVTVLDVDPAAVKAVLAGANDALVRELAWRGIPVDRRATMLRQLWPRPTRDGAGRDIDEISTWSGALADHVAGSDITMFVVRSALVRRFPTALYLCIPAITDPELGRKP
ncbi:MAG TPA: hypothetical protein VLT45_14020, partial [Kofleriaceae bacterium]|nr:hypothetical protein [Kofleriaceae bacterium]